MPVNESNQNRPTPLRARRWLAAAGTAVVLVAASAPALAIEPFTANYQATYMGMKADGRMVLAEAGDNRWRYSLDISNSLASLSQKTTFEEHNGKWRPLSSSDTSKVLVKKSDKQAEYDWGAGVARWSGDVKEDRSAPIKLQPGDMDALMINLALVRDVEAGKPLKYRMVDNGRVKQMSYKVAGTEQISVGGEKKQATKVVNTDGDKQTIAWVVDGMPVPARILQRKDGEDAIDLRVTSVD
ncbi:DUF3108 domain-containing protein [Novilysobacter arseniciresistens]|uniref:DUF3108 domain-containing protein n=1 Tax=Novilysobacter arseniciresistens TaxID=1385522 RepID=UPI00068D0C5F|nr:DUF3108 domain-containing protein [Lysobacter arseniciresistens]